MADAHYPMLHRQGRQGRQGRKGRRGRQAWRGWSAGWRRSRIGRGQAIALAVLAAAALAVLVLTLRSTPRLDPRRALAGARTAFAAGDYGGARDRAIDVLAVTPGSQPAMLLLARSAIRQGDAGGAEGAISRARSLHVPAALLAGLAAQARLLQGDAAGALDLATRAPAGDGEAVRARARAVAMQGDGATAVRLLEGWLADHPRDAAGWCDLARVRFDAGDVGAATMAAARARRLAPGDPVALTLAAQIVRTRYGLIAALPWFEAALRRDPRFHPALVEYAATLGEAGRYADMLAATRRALAARPGSPQALYLQAVLAMRAGRTELARDLLQRAGGAGTMAGTLLLAGALDLDRAQGERAIDAWRQWLDAQPYNLVARRLLGVALLRSGDAQGALDTLRPMALRPDADGYTLTLVARAFEATGDRISAARFLDRAAAGARTGAGAFASDDALGVVQAAAADDPGDPNALLGVIRAQLTQGDVAGAVARARRLALASPGAPAAQLALGDALVAGGSYGEAAGVYARAASLAFDEPTMLRLVDAWGRAGRPRDAAAALSLYLAQNPQSLVARRILGHWQLANGDRDAAIETLEAVRRMVGNRDAALLADLAQAYAAGDGSAVARSYARAAYALAPMNAAVCDAYAVALAADGDLGGARQLAAKAVALAPADPTIAAHRRAIAR